MTQDVTSWRPVLLSDWLQIEPPEHKWLIQGLLPASGITILSGQQKLAQKTTMALAAAIAVAAGLDVFGCKVEEAGKVLFVEGEGGWHGTRERIFAICTGLGVDSNTLSNFYWSYRDGVKLDSPEWHENLLRLVNEIKPALVVFDALTYLKTGDENDIHAMQGVANTLQDIEHTGTCVLLLMHLNKLKGANPKLHPDEQLRGSTIFSNLYDVHIAARKYSTEGPVRIQILDRFGEPMRAEVNWDMESETNEDGTRTLIRAFPKMSQLRPVTGGGNDGEVKAAKGDAFLREIKGKLKKLVGSRITPKSFAKMFSTDESTTAFMMTQLETSDHITALEGETYVVLSK